MLIDGEILMVTVVVVAVTVMLTLTLTMLAVMLLEAIGGNKWC